MRISMPTVLVCSTLTTLAFYQGYVAFSSGSTHADDESASRANEKATAAKAQQSSTIAAPESMTAGTNTRINVPATPGQLVANRRASNEGLPTANVPPTVRSLPTRLTERPSVDSSTGQNTSGVASPETSAIESSNPDVLDQNKLNAGPTQSLPFTSVSTPLADVKGHWAESYIESLAAKGIIRGFRDGSFRPDALITATQFALMTQKAFTALPVSYSDLQQLHPDRAPTRADAAAFIYQTLAKAASAPLTMAVQVSGAVPRPGIYAIANGSRIDASANAGVPTVSRAIQRAGGALEGADLHQVQIHRISETSAREVINVDVQQILQTGDRRHDLVLQQGDKLVIPAAPTAKHQIMGALPTPERTSPIESVK